MTKTRLLTSAALALAMAAGAAHAQTNAAPPASPPAAQQKAPPDKIAPPMNAGERKGGMPETGVKDDKAGMSAGKSGPDGHANDSRPSAKPSTTTGQGSAGARANLTSEQRSKITSVIKQQKVEKTNVNISISVGTRVPDHVRYYPLPAEVVTIYPQWRGLDYIIVGSTIVVIDPGTREIVAVLEA